MKNGNEPERKTSTTRAFFLGFIVLSLFAAPWFYGLTRFRDQLISELIIFSGFLIFSVFEGIHPRLSRGFRVGGPLDRWALGALALGAFYVVFSSLPYQSILTLIRLMSLVGFYFLVRWTVDTETKFRIVIWAFVALGTFYAVYGLFQFYGVLPHGYWRGTHGLASRYVNEGHFAALLLFTLLTGISLALSEKKILAKGFIVLLLIVQGGAFVLTRSRTGWLAFLIGIGILLSMARRKRYLAPGESLAAALVPALALFVFWQMGFLRLIFQRVGSLWDTGFFSLFHRWQWWEGSLDAILARPWGWGLGTFRAVLPEFRVHADRFLIDYAHNEFLQIGVDLGILGILFLIFFLCSYFGRLLRFIDSGGGPGLCPEIRSSTSPYAKRKDWWPSEARSLDWEPASRLYKMTGIGFAALGTALLLSSLVDFPLRIHANSLLLFTVLALSAHLLDAGRRRPRPLAPFWARTFCVVLVLAAGVVAARQLMAQLHFERGKKLEADFSWEKAGSEYRKAASLAPFSAQSHKALGNLFQKRAAVSLNPKQKGELRSVAIEAFERAVRAEPRGSGWSHYALANLYREAGDSPRAFSHYERAVSEEPKNALFVSDYGTYALKGGDKTVALRMFERLKGISFQENVEIDPCELLRQFSSLGSPYEDLKRITPNNPRGYFCLGAVLGEAGDWERAAIEFKVARHRGRAKYNSPQAYITQVGQPIAEFYLSHRQHEEARRLYEEFLMLEPGNPQHRLALEEIFKESKRQGAERPDNAASQKPELR